MGHVHVKATLVGEKRSREFSDLLVDTGAAFTVLPPEVIHDIGAILRPRKIRLELGDGRKVDAEEYVLDIMLEGREGSTFALTFKDAKPVLGVLTMESLGLKVNPVSGKVEAARPPGVAYYY